MKLVIYAWNESNEIGCSAFLYWAQPSRTLEWFPYVHQRSSLDPLINLDCWRIGRWNCELTRL